MPLLITVCLIIQTEVCNYLQFQNSNLHIGRIVLVFVDNTWETVKICD